MEMAVGTIHFLITAEYKGHQLCLPETGSSNFDPFSNQDAIQHFYQVTNIDLLDRLIFQQIY